MMTGHLSWMSLGTRSRMWRIASLKGPVEAAPPAAEERRKERCREWGKEGRKDGGRKRRKEVSEEGAQKIDRDYECEFGFQDQQSTMTPNQVGCWLTVLHDHCHGEPLVQNSKLAGALNVMWCDVMVNMTSYYVILCYVTADWEWWGSTRRGYSRRGEERRDSNASVTLLDSGLNKRVVNPLKHILSVHSHSCRLRDNSPQTQNKALSA